MKKLKGFIQSGILFIGDPSYMSGPVEYAVAMPGGTLNGRELSPAVPVAITPDDPYNPFRKFDNFTATLQEEDQNLKFYNTPDEGMGVAVQTNRISGQYEIERIEDTDGKLLELRIKFKD